MGTQQVEQHRVAVAHLHDRVALGIADKPILAGDILRHAISGPAPRFSFEAVHGHFHGLIPCLGELFILQPMGVDRLPADACRLGCKAHIPGLGEDLEEAGAWTRPN